MSATTVQFLVTRLVKADSRWDAAMARPGYRDDPDEADAEGLPFTEVDWTLYGFADAWRLAVHAMERELFSLPHYRQFLLDLHSSGEGATFFVAESSPIDLAPQDCETPEPQPEPPPARKPGTQSRAPKSKRG